MKPKKEIQEELKEISPFLANLEKGEGFQIPTNYFQHLSEDIMDKIDQEEQVKTPEMETPIQSISIFDQFVHYIQSVFQPKPVFALASIMLMAFGTFFFLQKTTTKENIAALTDDELEYYLAENIENFDDEILYEFGNETLNNQYLDDLDLNDVLMDEILDDMIDGFDDETLDNLL